MLAPPIKPVLAAALLINTRAAFSNKKTKIGEISKPPSEGIKRWIGAHSGRTNCTHKIAAGWRV
jgi:hypothetical protein